jgi:hypothetical protein
MVSTAEVRRIARKLPGVEAVSDHYFAFGVRNKGRLKKFVWTWMERVDPKKPRVPNPAVLAVRVESPAKKDELIASKPATFFTEPHYDGFPAVLVRLDAIRHATLEKLIVEAWRTQASKDWLLSQRQMGGLDKARSGSFRKRSTR